MKRWGLVMAFLWWWVTPMSTAFGDDPIAPAVLNDPTESVNLVKQIVNRIQPSYETVIDLYNGDTYQGMSGSLYTFTSRDLPIASVRLGVSTGMAVYSGASLDLPGITARFVPTVVKDVVSPSPIDSVWSVIGKFGRGGGRKSVG